MSDNDSKNVRPQTSSMDEFPRFTSSRVLLVSFIITALAIAVTVKIFDGMDQLLTLLFVVIVIAGYYSTRPIYITMVAILTALGLWVTENFTWEFNDSKVTVVVFTFATLGAAEALHRLARRQRRMSGRVRESEYRLRSLIEQAADAIFIHDLLGKFIEVNRQAVQNLGYTREELLTMNITDIDVEWSDERVRQTLPELFRDLPQTVEGVHKRKDGTTFPVEVRLGEYLIGDEKLILSLVRDVTERKRSEELLRDSEALLRSILDSSPDFVLKVDLDGTIQFINRTAPGLSHSDIEGKPVFDYLDERYHGSLADCFEGIRITRDPDVFDVEFVDPEGKERFIEARIAPIIKDDEVTAFTVHGTEITERKRSEEKRLALEKQMQQAQKLESLGVLAGGIAHDFNNLLLGVMGNADMALLSLPETAGGREHIADIITSAQRAADLCKQLLAYSGKGKFVIQTVDLAEIIEDVAHLLEVSISKKAILKYDFAHNVPAVECDVTQVRQIIMNLITNASDAIGEKSGIITVSTGAVECDRAYLRDSFGTEDVTEGLYVYLEVTDTGGGMDKETLAKIFDPFFSSKAMGRGLGLAAILGIVRGHQGAVRVYSEVGRGTTFRVLLPASENAAESIPYEEQDDEGWKGEGTILIVDDEETIRALGRKILGRIGFNILVASDGLEGVDIYQKQKDDIVAVLLDMTMPRLNGEETFRELRRINPHVKVVLSSGYNEQEATNRFTGKGLAGFIQKPYRAQDLVKTFKRILTETTSRDSV